MSLVGPAGVGKTTLARAVVDRVRADASLGVSAHFVDLTEARDAGDTTGAVARAVGLALADAGDDEASHPCSVFPAPAQGIEA